MIIASTKGANASVCDRDLIKYDYYMIILHYHLFSQKQFAYSSLSIQILVPPTSHISCLLKQQIELYFFTDFAFELFDKMQNEEVDVCLIQIHSKVHDATRIQLGLIGHKYVTCAEDFHVGKISHCQHKQIKSSEYPSSQCIME